jgi:hypothetical protein
MFLCHNYHSDGYGVICTNNCPEYYRCDRHGTSFLVHVTTMVCVKQEPIVDQIHLSVFRVLENIPDAYINRFVL